jgi:transposase-like protein
MTYSKFMELFPDNDACLDYLKAKFHPDGSECPGCRKATKFHRLKSRAAYSCQYCRHQVYPTAGTIFHKSTTNLQLWFWAIFLMSSTRCGISAKQLEREIGVSYPTAHRMFKQIRSLLSDDNGEPLSGEVEADETYVDGKARAWPKMSRAEHRARKVVVMGAVERQGEVRASVVPDALLATIGKKVKEYILPRSILYTDEAPIYLRTGLHYDHRRIYHQERIYVQGDVHTNTIEGFFGLVKNGIRGVYHSVSRAYLQSYLDEYAFRYNRRNGREPIFWAILDRVQKDDRLAVL